jgi:hypothetical protein
VAARSQQRSVDRDHQRGPRKPETLNSPENATLGNRLIATTDSRHREDTQPKEAPTTGGRRWR